MNFKAIFMALLGTAMVLNYQQVWAQDDIDLLDMSLEDLMNMEVTSVSKKAERLQDVASSIYVLSSDDILKSGATTLHEALRLVPGYWGVQASYSQVYSSIRNSPTANSDPGTMLFLLDGTPIQELMGSYFSFENFDIPLDEIDRIEVIRGSGGTIYGANSATGVVNIFTKSPEDYDGINARIEGASPGYVNTTVRAGGMLSDKIGLSGYAKVRHFSGFEEYSRTTNGSDYGSNFTKDYDASTYYSAGLKLSADLSEKSKLSARTHFNARNQYIYTSSYSPEFFISREDVLHGQDVNSTRFVGNIRYDLSFNEQHSLFARVSTNSENDFYRLAGGFTVNNNIYDFEIQDNFAIGDRQDVSVGVNARLVNFDIKDINDPTNAGYVDPTANENLKGAFIQDKISVVHDKLNFILGIKAENYSLINDDFYLSPMAKVTYIASKNLTLWGGFTQSYATPGFNQTNIDLFLFQSPTADIIAPAFTPLVTAGVRDAAYQQAIAAGADEATANAQADGFLSTPEGQAAIAQELQNQADGIPDIAVQNGSSTEPTKFQTWEFGIKASLNDNIQFNTSIYRTDITDGVAANPGNWLDTLSSPTQPGRSAFYYFYGNYVKGTNTGSETMLRFFPTKGLMLEVSHSWQKSDWDWQSNPEFDVSTITQDANPVENFIPEHVFRFRGSLDFGKGFNLAAGLIYASKHRTESSYVFANGADRYTSAVETDINRFEESLAVPTEVIAKDDTRLILNARLNKSWNDGKLNIYAFANDFTNSGKVIDTDNLRNTTLSQIGGMYGVGLNYRIK